MPVLAPLLEHVLKNSTLVALAIAAFYTYKYRSHAFGSRPRPDLKEPRGVVPLLEHLPLLATVPMSELYEFFEKQYKELGPVWSISLPGFGRIFSAEGAQWKFQHQIASNIFNIKAFAEYTSDVFVVEGKKVVDNLAKAADEGTVIDLQKLMLHFTLDTFGAVSFGKSFGCLNNIDQIVPLAEAIDDTFERCTNRLTDPIWKIRERLNGVEKKAQQDQQLLRNYAQDFINKHREEGNHADKKDILQFFLEGEDLIIDNIITFTFAARDTTAHALTWMFYLLLRDGADKDIMDRLVREVDVVLEGSNPTYETHKKQKYTEACFYEALRVLPVVPRNLRYCEKDDILPDGTRVFAGEWVTWSSYVTGRSELVWGHDAKEYRPSRWMNTEKPSPSKFNSFHAGPRVCMGQQFATIEALTVIAMILQSFDLTLEDPSRVPAYRTSLAFPMVGGLNVRVSKRNTGSEVPAVL
ncbi:hypothetical protein BGX26_012472 [Mortierella sp. AD094]|nr:hypothetical protein BGX26_012472 [Mortierella sp. AD094]